MMPSNGTYNNTGFHGSWNMTYHTPLTVIAFVIVIVNAPVILLYCKIPSLRHSAGNTFLVSLAIADILCACVMIPTAITCEVRVLDDGVSDHQTNVCVVYYMSMLTLSVASVYLIVAATLAKYFAIVHPMRNITECTKTRVNIILASVWIGSLLVGHIPFYLPSMPHEDQVKLMYVHARFLLAFAFVLPMLILTFIHIHMYAKLIMNFRSRALINETNIRSENNRRIASLFLVLFLFFIISWLPWYLLWAEFINTDLQTMNNISLLRFLSPVFNPLMFTFIKRDFRKAAMSLVTRLRGRHREFSSIRYQINATSSVDRTNFIDQQTLEPVMTKADGNSEPAEDAGIDRQELQII